MDAVRTHNLNFVRVPGQGLGAGEDGLELVVHVGQDFFSGEVRLLGVRDAVQARRIDLADEAEVVRVHDELAAVEAVGAEGVADVAGDEPLGEREAVVAEAQGFADRGASAVAACQVGC